MFLCINLYIRKAWWFHDAFGFNRSDPRSSWPINLWRWFFPWPVGGGFLFFSPSKLRSRSLLLESGAPEPERYKMEPYFTPPPKKMARKRHGFACFFFTQRWRKNSPGISTDIFLGPEPRNPRKVLAVTGSARSWKIRRGAHLFWWENVVNGLFTGPLRKW